MAAATRRREHIVSPCPEAGLPGVSVRSRLLSDLSLSALLRNVRGLSTSERVLRRRANSHRALLVAAHLAMNRRDMVAPAFRWPRHALAPDVIAGADTARITLDLRVAFAMVDLDWLARRSDPDLRHGNVIWADLVARDGEICLHQLADMLHRDDDLENLAKRLGLTPAEQLECAVLKSSVSAEWQTEAIKQNAAAVATLDRYRRDKPGPGSKMAMADWLDTHLAALHADHAGGTVAHWYNRITGATMSRQTASNRRQRLAKLGLL